MREKTVKLQMAEEVLFFVGLLGALGVMVVREVGKKRRQRMEAGYGVRTETTRSWKVSFSTPPFLPHNELILNRVPRNPGFYPSL